MHDPLASALQAHAPTDPGEAADLDRIRALVGHEPDLGDMTARWLGARGQVAFRKGAVCALEVDSATPSGPATLQWLLPPRALRRLAP